MFYVFSTVSTSVKIAVYGEAVNDMPAIKHVITIEGGANVINKKLITPKGVMTEVSDSDADALNQNPVFQRYVKGGFMKIEKKSHDPEKVASGMESRDNSAPLTPGDYIDSTVAAPTTSTTSSAAATNIPSNQHPKNRR